ncbi:peroxiredoxin Q [Thelephora ganbajun]|uniref:Peroxiredoxin Q n=1 Tax=Thelephora ganbajun TaxID=370292 RepID=A0ACB6ZC98_THEGA|nr:peroxiredoxin Q [Thelephora ganbajun]
MSPSSLIGKEAPAFTLKNHDGKDYEFKPDSATPTAIFFYPKSGSYGCTREACQFRDALVENDAFKGSNLRVIGISPDSVEEQDNFVKKQKLTYPVLSDSTGEFRKLYGVGKGILGLVDARVTYFVDSKGVVRDVVDATMNYAAHVSFVNKCLAKYAKEEATPSS